MYAIRSYYAGNLKGIDYVYQDVSTSYNTQLSSLPSIISWTFNMQQSRNPPNGPSGFDSNNYGIVVGAGCDDEKDVRRQPHSIEKRFDRARQRRVAAGEGRQCRAAAVIEASYNFV